MPTLVACPTCGRTQIDLIPIAKKVEEFLQEAVETARACGIPLEKLQEILALFYEESEE